VAEWAEITARRALTEEAFRRAFAAWASAAGFPHYEITPEGGDLHILIGWACGGVTRVMVAEAYWQAAEHELSDAEFCTPEHRQWLAARMIVSAAMERAMNSQPERLN